MSNPIPIRKEVHEARRNQMIDAALVLFAEKGYENATMKDLAEACGVAAGLVYHYFDSKEDLLMAVLDKHGMGAELEKVLLPAFDRPASEVLREVVQSYWNLLAERESFMRMIIREAMTNPELEARWQRMCNTGVQTLARYLAARVAAGELRPHDTEISARMLTHPVVVLRITGGSPAKLSSVVEYMLDGIRNKK